MLENQVTTTTTVIWKKNVKRDYFSLAWLSTRLLKPPLILGLSNYITQKIMDVITGSYHFYG